MDRDGERIAVPDPRPRTCPSAPATDGAQLLGLIGSDGRLHPVRSVMHVDQAFVDQAAKAGPVEARMRFAGRCQTDGCTQWTGTRCGVIDRAMILIEAATTEKESLPPCTIRSECRWFDQRGAKACGTCIWVVTDTRGATAAAQVP
jgi:hypothetical protein